MSKGIRSKIIVGLVLAGASGLSIPAPTAAQAQGAQSYCLMGGGGVIGRCGFATFEQCREAGAGFGICNPSAAPPAGISSSNARVVEPVRRGRTR